jgi:hypothetical protein
LYVRVSTDGQTVANLDYIAAARMPVARRELRDQPDLADRRISAAHPAEPVNKFETLAEA